MCIRDSLRADAVGLQPAVEAHAASGEALQEILAELLEDGLLVVLVHLVKLKTLGERCV